MYRHLDLDRIVETLERLHRRIRERFAESSLAMVAGELLVVAEQTRERCEQIRRPHWWLRVLIGVAICLIVVGVAGAIWVASHISSGSLGVAEFLQGLDAAVNEIVLIGAAIYFLVSFERRMKRRRILRGLHELRSIAHVIDAHQLTKDPEQDLSPRLDPTASSPDRTMSRFHLARYLDYCSELLSLVAKLAALHAQSDDDPVILAAVNDVESLAGNLSNKIWQKMTILDAAGSRAALLE
jgi:hypothetical protein